MSQLIDKNVFFKDLIDYYLHFCSENKIPGFSINVLEKGSIIGSRTFGIKKIGSLEPINQETLFGVGSVTKSFIAIGILLLVQRKTIKLEDSIENYFPVHFSDKYPIITSSLVIT